MSAYSLASTEIASRILQEGWVECLLIVTDCNRTCSILYWMSMYRCAVLPGSDFGVASEGYLRISYVSAIPILERGLEVIERALSKLEISGQ